MNKVDKEFASYREFEKAMFPNAFKKNQEERFLKSKNFGEILAHEFINNIRKELNK